MNPTYKTDNKKVQEIETSLIEVDAFPRLDTIKHGSLFGLSLSNNTSSSTHGIHRFAAKYIPQIPRWAIAEFCTKDSVVLDPFMGSGTTLVESLQSVEKSFGIDIDPLAQLIARVKTTPIAQGLIENHFDAVEKSISLDCGNLISPMSDVKNFGHWFSKDTWTKLQSLHQTILNLDCSASVKDFYFCVFSSIIRAVSKADNQSHKTYVSGTLRKEPVDVKDVFLRRLKKATKMVGGLVDTQLESAVATIIDSDAQNIQLPNDSVDLIVTSPPYLDSVDYMYNFMLEYFWLGQHLGVPTRMEFNSRRRGTTGAKNPHQFKKELPHEIQGLVKMDQIPDYRKKAIPAYFVEMGKHFSEASRVLKENGTYVLVVGNSKSGKGKIPVHDCLIKLAHSHGLSLEKAFAYRIRRHYMKFPRKGRGGIILLDWVIILKKIQNPTHPLPLPTPNFSLGDDDVAH